MDRSDKVNSFRYFVNALKNEILEAWRRIHDEGKHVPVHTRKAYRVNRSMPPLILYIGTRWR
jgi:hypothetical protein